MDNLQEFIGYIIGFISSLIPVVASLALLVFIWGLAKFIFKLGGDAKAVEEGKNLMIWGLVALFFMVSVFGIIAFLQRDTGLGSGDLNYPLLPGYKENQ